MRGWGCCSSGLRRRRQVTSVRTGNDYVNIMYMFTRDDAALARVITTPAGSHTSSQNLQIKTVLFVHPSSSNY